MGDPISPYVLGKIFDAVIDALKVIYKKDERLNELQERLLRLRDPVKQITDAVRPCDSSYKWYTQLKELLEKADDLLRKKNFWQAYRTSQDASRVFDKLTDLISETSLLRFASELSEKTHSRAETVTYTAPAQRTTVPRTQSTNYVASTLDVAGQTKNGASMQKRNGAGPQTRNGAGKLTKNGSGRLIRNGSGRLTRNGSGRLTRNGSGRQTRNGAGEQTRNRASGQSRNGAGGGQTRNGVSRQTRNELGGQTGNWQGGQGGWGGYTDKGWVSP